MNLNFNEEIFLVKLLKNHIENTKHNLEVVGTSISDSLKEDLCNEIDISSSIINQIIVSVED